MTTTDEVKEKPDAKGNGVAKRPERPEVQDDSRALSGDEIEAVLGEERLGRIGCTSRGRILIVPVSYVYDGDSLYGCSFDGTKIRAMRAAPHVCFEVERHQKNGRVCTVLAWGEYSELTGDEAERALELFRLQFEKELARRYFTEDPGEEAIFYRIRLTKKTGRVERPLRRIAVACRSRERRR